MVRQEAAKACGKLLEKTSDKHDEVIALLRIAAGDPSEKVRWKAQKSLRQLGAYSVSA
jgi:HEAT repeat protein